MGEDGGDEYDINGDPKADPRERRRIRYQYRELIAETQSKMKLSLVLFCLTFWSNVPTLEGKPCVRNCVDVCLWWVKLQYCGALSQTTAYEWFKIWHHVLWLELLRMLYFPIKLPCDWSPQKTDMISSGPSQQDYTSLWRKPTNYLMKVISLGHTCTCQSHNILSSGTLHDSTKIEHRLSVIVNRFVWFVDESR